MLGWVWNMLPWGARVEEEKKETAQQRQSQQVIEKTVELLEKREKLLTKKIEMEHRKAQECLKQGDKKAALVALRRKKEYQQQLEKLIAQRSNIDTLQLKTEEAVFNVQMIEAHSQGAQTLTAIYKKMDASKVEEKMEKVRDAMADADDISRALSQQLVITDDADVDDELAQLQDQIAEEEADSVVAAKRVSSTKVSPAAKVTVATTTTVQQPTAATKVAQKKKAEEEEDLSALEAELAS